MPKSTTRYAKVEKVIFFDYEKKNVIFMARPQGWEKAQVKVLGRLDGKPEEGETMKITGEITKEPWVDKEGNPQLGKNGQPLYNYVMDKASIEPAGPEKTLKGVVEKVLYSDEKSSIAMIRPAGFKHPVKVYAPCAVREGEALTVSGFQEKEYWQKEGKRVLNDKDEPLYSNVLRGIEAKTRLVKEYSGEILKVLHFDAEKQNAIVVLKMDKFGKAEDAKVKVYAPLSGEPPVGGHLVVQGIVEEEKYLRKDTGDEHVSLVIQGFRAGLSPQEKQIEKMSAVSPTSVETEEDGLSPFA